ncbi:unnamed protein product, partial [Mesorhabditis belari]|uniref:Protein kinase domain-containing protein n=1 Tax=Mesorhabditis belari TaxID=2138241 RepID=A0AAF3EDC8_9BILA
MEVQAGGSERKEVVDDLVKQLKALGRVRGSKKGKAEGKGDEETRRELTIKMRHKNTLTKIALPRNENGTVDWNDLDNYLQREYRRRMNMYYTYHGSNIMVAIRDQKELDTAVQMVDRSGQRNLYIILSMHESSTSSSSSSLLPDESGTYTLRVVEVPYTNNTPEPVVSSRMLSADSADSGSVFIYAGKLFLASSATSAQPSLPVNWRKGRCLGRGAFGEVCIAYDVDLSREVVFKHIVISPDETTRRDLHTLETDVVRLAQIRHVRLVQYLGVSIIPTDIMIFMEYMAGGSVKDLLNQYGKLAEKVAERYTKQVLEGLQFLHEELIAHRDIKSANILRDLYGNVKIGDFGSAKQLQALATQRGSCGGTPHYLAPEVVLGQREAGRRADIWSMGVTLVEMLTGKVPYRELPDIEATLKIAFEEPQCQLPEKINESLQTLTRSMMTKSYEDRPTARQLLETTKWNLTD